ncbi:LysR family transcriptional regulator [Paenibacillus sediminis]|uniref:DNA-binding transcriptional LysR family regulator n=1 Tax=Paenibacillus sediminis TaxID=664909 RepID=A0ABS4H0N4_9BACL|nr:LysR family transcriptional regulator [Paenibacillus sediminis]MBP1936084.1 DNA-binding transcriptional LysR family regulator [Paenibacillus sediminis]
MELIYFRTFREVAERRSFTRAAEELGYAQSSVTTQIQKLEKAYGVRLFERFGRQLRLTSSGESLLKVAIQMLDLYDESMEAIGQSVGSTLSIGTTDSIASYYLPSMIQHLREQFPELTIKLKPNTESNLIMNVREGEYDIGLLLDDKPADSLLHCIKIKEEPLIIAAHPDHPLVKQSRIEITDVHDSEWIMAEESCNYRVMLEKVLREHNVPYRIGFELGNPEAVKRCVMSGLGIALLPMMVVEQEIQRGELAALNFSHPDIKLNLQLLTHPKKWMSQPLNVLIHLLKTKSK